VRQEERSSFLKKRTKRLFLSLSRTFQAAPRSKVAKVFWFFSSEKNTFPYPPAGNVKYNCPSGVKTPGDPSKLLKCGSGDTRPVNQA
jgi:hypothetical protein